jgi:imidazolonepropionase-like amidohydrolase
MRPQTGWLATVAVGVLLAASPAAGVAQTVAITGGTVYPVSGPRIENGTVLIRDGKIVAVGANVAVPAGAQRIDATGRWVTPGFVNAATQLGVVDIGAVPETRDVSARGTEQIAASFRVWEGFNPRSVLIAPARTEGITTVVVVPTGGLVAGQAAITDLDSGETARRSLRGPVAMVAQLGNAAAAGVGARGEQVGRLRDLLVDARYYGSNRAAFERGDSRDLSASRADLEALQPVLAGRLPMLIAADRASDIETALDLAREFGLRIIIGGGAEAWQIAGRLASARVPVLTGAMNNIPSGFAALGQRQENAALLRRAGVSVAIVGNAGGGDEEAFNVRNLRYEAGNAVAYGMSWDDALRAVTLAPAEIFGAAASVGTLQPGKVANVVVWTGDPFEFSSRAEHVFVGGRVILERSRQQMLEDRYRTLPPAYRQP